MRFYRHIYSGEVHDEKTWVKIIDNINDEICMSFEDAEEARNIMENSDYDPWEDLELCEQPR